MTTATLTAPAAPAAVGHGFARPDGHCDGCGVHVIHDWRILSGQPGPFAAYRCAGCGATCRGRDLTAAPDGIRCAAHPAAGSCACLAGPLAAAARVLLTARSYR